VFAAVARTEDERQNARDDRDAWKRTSIWATALGATLSAAGGVALGGPVFVLGAVITICLRANAELKLVETQRRLEDPPRSDFHEPAIPQMVIPFRDGFGTEPVERALAGFARYVVETVSLENAMVTAHERAMGAQLYGAEEIAERRAAEHNALRAAVGRWNLQLRLNVDQLARMLEAGLIDEISAPLKDFSLKDSQAMWKQELDLLIRDAFPSAIDLITECGYPAATLGGAPQTHDPDSSPDELNLRLSSTPPASRPLRMLESLQLLSQPVQRYGEGVLAALPRDYDLLQASLPPLPFELGVGPYGRAAVRGRNWL
jgi:hypothetical protein